MKNVRYLLFALSLLLSESAVSQTIHQAYLTGVDTSAFPLVSFYVHVPDLNGFTGSMNAGNTIVRENGAVQAHSIDCGSMNTYYALVVDKSLSMAFKPNTETPDPDSVRWRALKASVKYFADLMTPSDQACLISYSAITTSNTSFSSDPDPIKGNVERLRLGSGTATFDACYRGIDSLKSKDGKRILLLFTDGDDNSSKWGRDEFTSIEYAMQSGVSIYTIGLGEFRDSTRLKSMAEKTGGRFYLNPTTSSLDSIIQEVKRYTSFSICRVQYTSTHICPDAAPNTVIFEAQVDTMLIQGTASYHIPTITEQLLIDAEYPLAVNFGEAYPVELLFRNPPAGNQPLTIDAELEFDTSLFVFEKLTPNLSVFGNAVPSASVTGNKLALHFEAALIPDSLRYLATLHFSVKRHDYALPALFAWQSTAVHLLCPTETYFAPWETYVGGSCVQVLVKRGGESVLQSVYPNPVQDNTLYISYRVPAIPAEGQVISLTVQNTNGTYEQLIDKAVRLPGDRTFTWTIPQLPNGAYWLRLQSDLGTEVKSFIMMRRN